MQLKISVTHLDGQAFEIERDRIARIEQVQVVDRHEHGRITMDAKPGQTPVVHDVRESRDEIRDLIAGRTPEAARERDVVRSGELARAELEREKRDHAATPNLPDAADMRSLSADIGHAKGQLKTAEIALARHGGNVELRSLLQKGIIRCQTAIMHKVGLQTADEKRQERLERARNVESRKVAEAERKHERATWQRDQAERRAAEIDRRLEPQRIRAEAERTVDRDIERRRERFSRAPEIPYRREGTALVKDTKEIERRQEVQRVHERQIAERRAQERQIDQNPSKHERSRDRGWEMEL